jgi:hypothetical protein
LENLFKILPRELYQNDIGNLEGILIINEINTENRYLIILFKSLEWKDLADLYATKIPIYTNDLNTVNISKTYPIIPYTLICQILGLISSI